MGGPFCYYKVEGALNMIKKALPVIAGSKLINY